MNLPNGAGEMLRLACIPLISAFIGWFTIWLTAKMFLRPRSPRRFLGMTIQGVAPARQDELAQKLGRTVQEQLLSRERISSILNRPDLRDAIDTAIRGNIAHFMSTRFPIKSRMLNTLINGALREKLETMLCEKFNEMAPQLAEQLIGKLEKEAYLQRLVEERIRGIDLNQLEQIVFASRELKLISLMGGVLGFLIGLIQLLLLII